jgi:hypothetical protein
VNLLFFPLKQLNIKQENMKRKLGKEIKRQFKNILFSSLKQFNTLQIKLLCFNCLTKRISKHIFSYICIKNIDTCRNSKIKTQLLYIYILLI